MDLGTTDIDGAKAFYASLFGWELADLLRPDDSGDTYTVGRLVGQDAAGLYQLCPEMKEAGVSAHWMAYVSVESADKAATKASSLGATVRVAPFDIPGVGRMGVIVDPTGAHLGLWQND